MADTSPWSVKGVQPESRVAAKVAAHRAGLTVGQWLSRTIRTVAAQQPDGNRRSGSRPQSDRSQSDADALHEARGAPPKEPLPPPEIKALSDRIQELSQRIERIEMETHPHPGPPGRLAGSNDSGVAGRRSRGWWPFGG